MTVLASLAKEVGVDERTLRRAVSQGTLRGSRPSPRRLELSLSERAYVRRSWRLIADLRDALRTDHNVRFALLFGSAARGTDEPHGDVDVLVALRDPQLDRVADLRAKLARVAGRPADVVRVEDAEADPAFLAAVLGDGRVLVDRDRRWPSLRERWHGLDAQVRELERTRARAALAGIDRLLGS